MEITFPKKSAIDSELQVVSFPAVVDGVQLRVMVSREALQDHFGANAEDLLRVFEENRSTIEALAKRFLADGAEEDLLLQSKHF